MARRRPKPHGLRSHRSYTVEEAARAAGVCAATVRRWVKQGLVKPIDQTRPVLLAGADLLAAKRNRSRTKARTRPNEAYCMRCRAIRPMAYSEAEIVSANASGVNLRALCGVCSTVMHKRVARSALPMLAEILTITATQAQPDLIDTVQPRVNMQSGRTGKAPPAIMPPNPSDTVGRGG